MRVRALSFNDDPESKAVLYACGVCGKCYSPKDVGVQSAVEIAEQCCAPNRCRDCGVEVEKWRVICVSCNERARLRKAAQIEAKDWTDPVQLDGAPGGWGEGYFVDTDELLADWAEEHWVEIGPQLPPPAYCWPCTSRSLALNAESLLERAVDDMHEDAADQIVDADGLCEFIEAWNAKQTCVSWYPDHSRVVVLDRERFQILIEGAAP